MALPAPNRPLNPSEAMLWWMDRGAPLHFTTVLDFEGPTTESALRAALDAVARVLDDIEHDEELEAAAG